MREARIPSFAKINLRLDILGKRGDSYHELRTIFQTISLHDELRLRVSPNPGISLTIHGNQELSREPASRNLVYRAVDALKRELKIRGGFAGFPATSPQEARPGAAGRNRRLAGRGRAVFPVWRAGAGSEQGRRTLSPGRHPETLHSGCGAAPYPCVYA